MLACAGLSRGRTPVSSSSRTYPPPQHTQRPALAGSTGFALAGPAAAERLRFCCRAKHGQQQPGVAGGAASVLWSQRPWGVGMAVQTWCADADGTIRTLQRLRSLHLRPATTSTIPRNRSGRELALAQASPSSRRQPACAPQQSPGSPRQRPRVASHRAHVSTAHDRRLRRPEAVEMCATRRAPPACVLPTVRPHVLDREPLGTASKATSPSTPELNSGGKPLHPRAAQVDGKLTLHIRAYAAVRPPIHGLQRVGWQRRPSLVFSPHLNRALLRGKSTCRYLTTRP